MGGKPLSCRGAAGGGLFDCFLLFCFEGKVIPLPQSKTPKPFLKNLYSHYKRLNINTQKLGCSHAFVRMTGFGKARAANPQFAHAMLAGQVWEGFVFLCRFPSWNALLYITNGGLGGLGNSRIRRANLCISRNVPSPKSMPLHNPATFAQVLLNQRAENYAAMLKQCLHVGSNGFRWVLKLLLWTAACC